MKKAGGHLVVIARKCIQYGSADQRATVYAHYARDITSSGGFRDRLRPPSYPKFTNVAQGLCKERLGGPQDFKRTKVLCYKVHPLVAGCYAIERISESMKL